MIYTFLMKTLGEAGERGSGGGLGAGGIVVPEIKNIESCFNLYGP